MDKQVSLGLPAFLSRHLGDTMPYQECLSNGRISDDVAEPGDSFVILFFEHLRVGEGRVGAYFSEQGDFTVPIEIYFVGKSCSL